MRERQQATFWVTLGGSVAVDDLSLREWPHSKTVLPRCSLRGSAVPPTGAYRKLVDPLHVSGHIAAHPVFLEDFVVDTKNLGLIPFSPGWGQVERLKTGGAHELELFMAITWNFETSEVGGRRHDLLVAHAVHPPEPIMQGGDAALLVAVLAPDAAVETQA